MRLLERAHNGEFSLTKDIVDNDIPPYAILSHTWGPDTEEVAFKDLVEGTGKNKIGYNKIRFCAEQAKCDRLQYLWVDTCCIDKSNNTELQEAINSMFRWYRDAAKCYVYLSDVLVSALGAEDKSSQPRWKPAFRKSRWFTRGWTLQELIAPASVEFFSKEGVLLGSKRSLEESIHEITGIPLKVLRGSSLSEFSISERMAWTEKRVTTRKEDRAYSLLGIFDIHMPLIYGEGEGNAFRRLREEINKASNPELLPIPVANDAAFDSRAEEHNARCHPDTRVDLLRQIHIWASDPGGECIFWLNGVAGTGKSTISRTAAGSFREQGVLGASFFFKRGERDRGNAALFFTTIATELVSHKPKMSQFLRAAINSDPAIATRAIREQFEKLILQPLSQLYNDSRDPRTIAMVIDALDECDHHNDIRLIIHLFSQMKILSSVRLRVFITSRPELPIRLGFKDIRGKYQDVVLHQIPEPVIEHDIAAYLRYELTRIRDDYNSLAFDDQRLPPNWPGEHIIQTLVRMAIPLFIFAATVCRFVADETWLDPRGRLDQVLNYQKSSDSGLNKLDSTYLPVLDQLVVGKTGSTRSRLVSEFRDIVGPIVLLAEPLSASSLSDLLGIPATSTARTLNRLHAVLDVPSKAGSPIRPFHLSFRDFLTDPFKCSTNEFWIDERQTHGRLAVQCLQILSTNLKRDVCGLSLPGTRRSEIDLQTIDACLPPEVQYACQYWVYHWQESGRRIWDGDPVDDFLTRHLLYWLEALGLLGRISESIGMVDGLLGLLDAEASSNISGFLRDTRRIILSHCSVIDTSPLQVYYSAIVFAPEQSIVRKKFRNQFPACFSLLPQVNSDWDACLQTLEGYSSSAVFSHDSRMAASASDDYTMRVLDMATGTCTATLKDHRCLANPVAFSQDSTLIASTSYGYTVKLWDTATGTCTATLEGHSYSVKSVTFSHDSRMVASASLDKTAKLWDTATGRCTATLKGHSSYADLVVFSHDSKLLASASHDNTVKLWDTATGTCVATLKGHSNFGSFASSVAFSHDSTLITSAPCDNTVKLWDTATGTCTATLKGHSDSVYSVVFSRDSTMVASASSDQTVRVWDTATGTCTATLKGHSHSVYSVLFLHDSTKLLSASWDRTIKVWDTATRTCTATLEGHSSNVSSVVFSHDSTMVASASDDYTVRVWDTATGTCTATLKGHGGSVNSVAFSHDSTLIVSTSRDKTVKVWDTATGTCVVTLEGYRRHANSIAFSHDSTLIALASRNNTITVWDTTTGSCTVTLEGHRDSIYSVVFSHNSTLLASASGDKTAKVWDTATGSCTAMLQGHSQAVSSVAFSHDSTLIASASGDRTIKLWDTATGSCTATLEGHSDGVYSVVFSHDSTFIASTSGDKTIKVWEAATGSCTAKLNVGTRVIRHLAFDAASSSLYTDVATFIFNRQPLSSPPPTPGLPAAGPPASPASAPCRSAGHRARRRRRMGNLGTA